MKFATLCYVKKDNKTLMVHVQKETGINKGYWNGLGGKLEEGETPEECVVREVEEESGLKIINPKFRGIITFPNNVGQGEAWYVFIFTATSFNGKLKTSDEGELVWVKDSELLNLKLQEGDKLFLEWINDNKFFSAKLTYVNKKLENFSVNFY